MKVIFKYSVIKELAEYFTLLTHPKDYKHLRSVVWNPTYILAYSLKRKNVLAEAESIWGPLEAGATEAFSKQGLSLLRENVICYVHSVGCEGWYDFDKKQIHVRLSECTNPGNFAGTVIHELIHLAVCKNGQGYDERERLVDSYTNKSPLLELLKLMGDTPQSSSVD